MRKIVRDASLQNLSLRAGLVLFVGRPGIPTANSTHTHESFRCLQALDANGGFMPPYPGLSRRLSSNALSALGRESAGQLPSPRPRPRSPYGMGGGDHGHCSPAHSVSPPRDAPAGATTANAGATTAPAGAAACAASAGVGAGSAAGAIASTATAAGIESCGTSYGSGAGAPAAGAIAPSRDGGATASASGAGSLPAPGGAVATGAFGASANGGRLGGRHARAPPRLYIVANGNGSPCLDLRRVPGQLADATVGVDLLVIEGMGRAIHTNLATRFKCDTLKLAMIKTERLARRLFNGALYDCVCTFDRGVGN